MTLAMSSDADGRGMARLAEVVSPAPREIWADLVRADSEALVTQTPEWTDAMVRTGKFVDVSRLYSFEDGRRFVLPLARRHGPAGALLGDQGFPNGWGIGGLVGPQPDTAVVAAVFDDLRSRALHRTQIRPNPRHGSLFRDGAPRSVHGLARRAHVIDVRNGIDDVWTRFSRAARRGVRKGEKAGLDVEHGSSERLVREYYALHEKSVARWAAQQHEPLALARRRAEARDGLKKWLTIADVLGPLCRISVARLGGEPVGAMVLLRGPNGHETRSAFDRERTQGSDPTYLLTWLGIQESVACGAGWYHLGESGTSTRLADFKERFAAEPYDYADYRVERIPVTRTDLLARAAVKRLIGFQD